MTSDGYCHLHMRKRNAIAHAPQVREGPVLPRRGRELVVIKSLLSVQCVIMESAVSSLLY